VRFAFRWLLLAVVCIATVPAFAHSSGISYLALDAPSADGPVQVRWELVAHDLMGILPIDADHNGVLTWQEMSGARASLIEPAIIRQLTLQRGGASCRLEVTDVALVERIATSMVSVTLSADCPKSGHLVAGGPLFLEGDATQRVLVSLSRGQARLAGVISTASPAWTEPAQPSAWASFVRFVGEGIWHVLIGYDHVAFLLLLLLPSVLRPVEGRWQGTTRFSQVARDVVVIVTAFTVAHSITLALAVTGAVRLPSQPIEVAIAASIAIAGAINLLPRLSRLRLALAFGFGFVHGFGFANALGEIDAAGTPLLPLLAGFNIGVEIAQLGIVALVLPFIYLARGTRWYAGGVLPFGSCALGAAGVVWLLQRL